MPYVAKARLPNGETCSIGTGPLAESGGTMNVLNRSNVDAEDQATVILSWESTGKSVMQGTDCGHAAELTMTENELIYLRTAATELVSEFPSVLQ